MTASDQDMTISGQLRRHAHTIPAEVALRFGEQDLSYARLDERVDRLCNALRQRGVATGERVAVMARNGLETVEVYFACARLGAICVPINFRLTAHEVRYLLADSGARVAITDMACADVLRDAKVQASNVRHCLLITSAEPHPGSTASAAETEDYEKVLAQAGADPVRIDVDEHAPAFIMYTSGTTGDPKGAVLTHQNLFVQVVSRMIHIGQPPDCRTWLCATPLFHIAALGVLMSSVFVGGRAVLTASGGFDPAGTVDLLETEGIGYAFFVPAQWQAICDVPGIAERDLSSLRMLAWGAAPATPALLTRMAATFPQASISSVFGQTETSPVTTVLRGEDALRKIGSIGTPLLNAQVRVVDEEMNDVAPGEVGEIVYRGPMVMKEYWNKPQQTAEAFAGGWFHSGDLVRQDEDGYLYVVDRKKDMIISGGENIYCAEVENAIAEHPQVAEVAVVGMPHERWDETPMAFAVPVGGAGLTSTEIDRWCRERLAAYKCPGRISVVSELPRNATGKVLKTRLRERARELAAPPREATSA